VVTIGALIGMAAHLDGKGVTVLDMTGLAQKGGAVMSHVRLAERQEQLHSARIATGEAMLGLAFQRGLVPLSLEAILRAIELNGAAVADNLRAFHWGRRAAHDPAGVAALTGGGEPPAPEHRLSANLDELIERRRDYLAAYQDAAYARRYTALVARVRAHGEKVGAGDTALADAVARNYFKLLAYKDEYEVARLFAEPAFQQALAANFEGDYRLNFHMTLPWSRAAGPGAEPPKQGFGPWLLPAMKLLARFRFLRGTAFNPFGRSAERVQERELIADYERMLAHILDTLDTLEAPDAVRRDAAVALARLPETIRGYGPVKERSVAQARARQKELLAAFDGRPG
jgi:indolepyruvate ferredoxin oxidoreductase